MGARVQRAPSPKVRTAGGRGAPRSAGRLQARQNGTGAVLAVLQWASARRAASDLMCPSWTEALSLPSTPS